MTPLPEQIERLQQLYDEHAGVMGSDEALRDAIATLKLIAEFPDDVREAIRQAKERKRVMQEAGSVIDAVLAEFPGATVKVSGGA